MNEIPISPQEPRGGKALIQQSAERIAVLFARFKLCYFMYIDWSRFRKDFGFWKVSRWPKGKNEMNWQRKSRTYLVQKRPFLKGCTSFQEEEWKEWDANMHFQAQVTRANNRRRRILHDREVQLEQITQHLEFQEAQLRVQLQTMVFMMASPKESPRQLRKQPSSCFHRTTVCEFFFTAKCRRQRQLEIFGKPTY